MNTPASQPDLLQRSTTARFFRWLFRWRTIRVVLFIVFCLVSLVFLIVAEENWRGRRAWETFRQAGEAKGERYDLASFIPRPVPPEQNFAMTPFLAPLMDYDYANSAIHWRDSNALARAKSVTMSSGERDASKVPALGNMQRGELADLKAWQAYYRDNTNFPSNPQPQEAARDVLVALQKYAPVLTELQNASQRPYAFFPLHHDETFLLLLEHLSVLKGLTQVVVLRALAELEVGQSDQALADTKLALHFARSLQQEPTLISHLVRIAILQISTLPVWEGLAKHQWTDAQLSELQKSLGEIHPLQDYGQAMRGERAFGNELMAQWRAGRFPGGGSSGADIKGASLLPRGWLYQNQLVISRLHQDCTLPAVDAAAHRVYPEKSQENAIQAALGRRTPYNVFAWLLFPAFNKAVERFAQAQTTIDQAILACALERYRLANGKYPEALDALVPKFMDKVPTDVINGQPLKYRLDDAGQPLIYSVGWNQTDEGGTVVLNTGSTPRGANPDKGDWVWRYPSK